MGRVLVACEFSGVVRRAFRAMGHDAWSCDLLPAEDGDSHHIRGDARSFLTGMREPWDLLIAHPPCTYMANSGAKHLYLGMRKENGPNPERWESMREAADFFLTLWRAPIPRIAVENPIMLGHAQQLIGKRPAQVIQPWQHGHGETKATCLWLKNLPLLKPSNIVEGREQRVFRMPPSADRWKERSRTFEGIAAAMAAQWGPLIEAERIAA
jgi:hypothetical protein